MTHGPGTGDSFMSVVSHNQLEDTACTHGGVPPEDQGRSGAEMGAGTLLPFLLIFFLSYPHTER